MTALQPAPASETSRDHADIWKKSLSDSGLLPEQGGISNDAAELRLSQSSTRKSALKSNGTTADSGTGRAVRLSDHCEKSSSSSSDTAESGDDPIHVAEDRRASFAMEIPEPQRPRARTETHRMTVTQAPASDDLMTAVPSDTGKPDDRRSSLCDAYDAFDAIQSTFSTLSQEPHFRQAHSIRSLLPNFDLSGKDLEEDEEEQEPTQPAIRSLLPNFDLSGKQIEEETEAPLSNAGASPAVGSNSLPCEMGASAQQAGPASFRLTANSNIDGDEFSAQAGPPAASAPYPLSPGSTDVSLNGHADNGKDGAQPYRSIRKSTHSEVEPEPQPDPLVDDLQSVDRARSETEWISAEPDSPDQRERSLTETDNQPWHRARRVSDACQLPEPLPDASMDVWRPARLAARAPPAETFMSRQFGLFSTFMCCRPVTR